MRFRIANFNLHLGIDGFGRPYDVVAACRGLDADVLVLEEVFAPTGGGSLAGEVATELGYEISELSYASVRLLEPLPPEDLPPATQWGPGRHGGGPPRVLVLDRAAHTRRARQTTVPSGRVVRRGRIGIALLSRFPILTAEPLPLPLLRRELVPRTALKVEIDTGTTAVTVFGVHMSHLSKGSHRQFAHLRREIRAVNGPTVVVGDLNCWGPPLHLLLPGMRRVAMGPTWPAWKPRHQVDHILVTESIEDEGGAPFPAVGSDHLPIRSTIGWPSPK